MQKHHKSNIKVIQMGEKYCMKILYKFRFIHLMIFTSRSCEGLIK